MLTQSKLSENDSVEFQLTDIYFITGRGAILVGNILRGQLRIGMRIMKGDQRLTISGIEYVDYLNLNQYRMGIIFEEKPSKVELEGLFREGEIIRDFLA